MSRIISVLKNRNRRERQIRQQQKQALETVRMEMAYKARLHEDLKLVEMILADENVKNVKVTIPQKQVTQFMRALYGEEMAEYDILQVAGDTFEIGRKIIPFTGSLYST